MVYKGRIDLDNCDIYPIEDGKGVYHQTMSVLFRTLHPDTWIKT